MNLSRQDDGRQVVAITGLGPDEVQRLAKEMSSAERWRSWFAVRVEGADGPPMLGDYFTSGDRICFRPQFPLDPGRRYQVTVGREPATTIQNILEIPQQKLPPPAELAAIYPLANELPENLLRIYLQFTGPMRRGDVYDFIHLLGPDGKPVESPFVTFGEELWNAEGTRLTLLLDPGRQKHDLLPRQQAGPVLEAGKQYSLVISGDWPDAHGRPLGNEGRKQFRAIAAEPRAVQPADWKITSPHAGTREPLIVKFDRPLDHALSLRMLTVTDSANKTIEGEISLAGRDSEWQLTPKQPWSAGEFVLAIDKNLEDVSGNRVGRAFEVDEDRTEPGPVAAVRRTFTVAAKSNDGCRGRRLWRCQNQALDDYSEFASRLILERFPEWESFATVRIEPKGTGVFEVNIPCPSPAAKAGLLVTTAGEETTVVFHTEHQHFTNYDDRIDPQHIQDALDFADDILNERIAAINYYRDGDDAGGGWMDVPSMKPLPRGLINRVSRPTSDFIARHV